MKNKIVSTDEAIAIIRDRDTVAFSGFVGSGTPEELIAGSNVASYRPARRVI
jgi:propionate CoA-transferase